MTQQTDIRYFEGQQIRAVWDEDADKYFFSVVDVVQVLTDSANATDYFKKIRKREPELAEFVGTNCPHVEMVSDTGKRRKILAGDADAICRIMQYIPSKKTDQLKLWLESFENTFDPYKGEIVMYQPDETIKLEVRLDNETVWLNRQQMAELFDRDVKTIGKHISNALQEELVGVPTVAKFATVQFENSRSVRRQVEYYNLDMILSVGYRVKSAQGIKFRQWSNSILKQYLLKGYALTNRVSDLERTVSEQQNDIAALKNKVDFFVRTSLPPVEGIFYDGQIFDAFVQIVSLIKQAKKSIVVIDNYADETVLNMLSNRAEGVDATIYVKHNVPQFQLAVSRYNAQYQPVAVNVCQNVHDRFLIIDDMVYLFGASLKDAGKKLFAYIKMQETSAADILRMVH